MFDVLQYGRVWPDVDAAGTVVVVFLCVCTDAEGIAHARMHTHSVAHTHAHTHTAVTLLLVKFVEQFLYCLCGKSCVGV